MDLLIAGGGTGGHLFPGIAIAQELRRRDPASRILFVGSGRGIEGRAVPKAGFDLEKLPVSGLRRTGFGGLLAGMVRLPWAMLGAFRLVRRFQPDVALSVGGYAAGPAVLAARVLGVPCVVAEQNAVPGLTNRLLGRVASRIIVALPTKGLPADRVTVLGNPVRADLLEVRDSDFQPGAPLSVLIFGGSQGARALNEAMMAAAPALAEASLRILHQSGAADEARVRDAYAQAGLAHAEVRAFIDDMATAYREAHLVVCRAGATTVAELTVCGRPAIVVPYPYAVDDHQTANARTLADTGAAIHLPQSSLTGETLVNLLLELSSDVERLKQMAARARTAGKPDAARAIVDALEAEVQHV